MGVNGLVHNGKLAGQNQLEHLKEVVIPVAWMKGLVNFSVIL